MASWLSGDQFEDQNSTTNWTSFVPGILPGRQVEVANFCNTGIPVLVFYESLIKNAITNVFIDTFLIIVVVGIYSLSEAI